MLKRSFCTICCLVVAPWVAMAAPTREALPLDPAVHIGGFENGLSYYVRANAEPRDRAELWLAVRAGSVLETDEQRGLAHFVEHMAFNGTEHFAKNELIDYLESVGMRFGPDVNAYTSFDETVYTLQVPTEDPAVLESAFQILSDWAFGLALQDEEIEKERGVILEEWRRGRGADARMRDLQLPELLGPSRYAERLPIGEPDVIQGAAPDLLREFYRDWYRPDLMTVIAVGDFDVLAVEATIRRYFDRAAEHPRPEPERPAYGIPGHAETRVNAATDPEASISRVTLYRKIETESLAGETAYRARLVDALYGGMFNMRLFERTQEADPPFIGASAGKSALVAGHDALSLGATVDQDGVHRGLGAILEELERIKRHGFGAAELEREKANLSRTAERMFRQRDQIDSGRLAADYLDHFLEGAEVPGIVAEFELAERLLPDITLDEVNAVVARWARPGNLVLLTTGPVGAPSGRGAEADLLAQLRGAGDLEVARYLDRDTALALLATPPPGGLVVEESDVPGVDATQWRLDNGVTVIAKQTDFRDDQVLLRAVSPGGNSLAEDADYLAALTASTIVAGSGVGPHSRLDLERLLAGKTVSLSPYIGELFEGMPGEASPDDLQTLFELVYLYATEPRGSDTFFSSYLTRLSSAVENRRRQPEAVFGDALQTILTQSHFRARPLTVELLDEMDLQRSLDVYRDRFADFSDATFVIVGAFDWGTLRRLTETYLGSLPGLQRQERWQDVGIDPPSGRVDEVVFRGLEPKSSSRLVFAGEMSWSRSEALALTVMGDVLQIRLRESLREELGGTYSVRVTTSARALPDQEYQVQVAFGSDPERADELMAAVLQEVQWLRDGGEQSYLEKVREIMRSDRQEQLRRNGFWLSALAAALERGEPLDDFLHLSDRLDALQLADVASAAQRYLTPENQVRVVLLPAAAAE